MAKATPKPGKQVKTAQVSATQLKGYPGKIARWLGQVVAFISILATVLGFVDAYSPKFTITAGPTLNSKRAFETRFIAQNQGYLRVTDVRYGLQYVEMLPWYTTTNTPLMSTQAINMHGTVDRLQSCTLMVSMGSPKDNPEAVVLRIGMYYRSWILGIYPIKSEQHFVFSATKDQQGNYQWFPAADWDKGIPWNKTPPLILTPLVP